MRAVPAMMLLLLAGAPVAALADEALPLARAPSEMTGAEIDAHNQGLAFADPDYIKCRKIEEVGSLVKKIRVCNTNAQWRKIADKGNQDARDSMETLARGWSNSREPADQVVPTNNRPP
ncbi:hypothetical protein [Sphingopyxis sp. PET50]|uniref:hypothetical protein n=1 Tax=Sphingopyxis sp. PET50 TaxID=2976533 RepID=UPI0021B04DAC|nr:hypothetical protein [Sphingopyxis sp. PET50]